MTSHVPTATTLSEIYTGDVIHGQERRWERLLAKFHEIYQRPAGFVSRSPGRVNIIGEHIDYMLYEVLPMAVTADLLIAVAVHPPEASSSISKIRIRNVNSSKFADREFPVSPTEDVAIDASVNEWSNYFKSGLRGALDLLRKKRDGDDLVPVGMDLLVDGTVPSGGGLSSSAAFVCASALAVMIANGEKTVDKTELVELAIVSERAVGVNSGGMDQSASVFSLRGSALYVSFQPTLHTRAVTFPATQPELAFLIAQTFVQADKHVTGPVNYNLRVVECTLAAEVLAKKLGLKKPLPKDAGPLGVSLRGLQDTYFEEVEGIDDNDKTSPEDFHKQLERLLQLGKENLTEQAGYTREEVASTLGITVDTLNERYTSRFPIRAERFLLRQRVEHVFSEALRVLDFMALLESPPADSQTLLKSLGSTLNASQQSCRDNYNCSCPELDELCQLALGAGAYGSRLTGAGWGGCSVHLVPLDKVDDVRGVWEREYYRKHFPDISDEKLQEAVVRDPVPLLQYFFRDIRKSLEARYFRRSSRDWVALVDGTNLAMGEEEGRRSDK
ncbi:MAG: galactokinase [Geoglossum umbratile]|nr:MAG: galactokinase [Geoglossum umbratile]